MEIFFKINFCHSSKVYQEIDISGNSLAVQCLGLSAFTAEGLGSVPCRGTEIPQEAAWHGQKKENSHRQCLKVFCFFSNRNSAVFIVSIYRIIALRRWTNFFFFHNFLFFLAALGLCCFTGFSLVVASGGCSLVVVCGLLIVEHRLQGAEASMAVAHGLSSVAPGLQCTRSVVVLQELSCSMACGIFPDQGSKPCLLLWQANSVPLRIPGKPRSIFIKVKFS